MQFGIAIRPDRGVWNTIKASVGTQTSGYLDERRCTGGETSPVIAISRLSISSIALSIAGWARAANSNRTSTIAVVEVADLIGEGDVIRMRCPGHAGLLRRGAVHGMEVIRNVVARAGEWDLAETIRSARRHRTGMTRCLIVNNDLQAMRRIVQLDCQPVPGVHEEICIGVRSEGIN